MTTATCSCCDETVQTWVTLWSRQDIVICYGCLDYLNSLRVRQIAIHGGLQPLAGYAPVFRVLEVERAVDHYQRLGFTTDYRDGPTPSPTGATSSSILHATSIPKRT